MTGLFFTSKRKFFREFFRSRCVFLPFPQSRTFSSYLLSREEIPIDREGEKVVSLSLSLFQALGLYLCGVKMSPEKGNKLVANCKGRLLGCFPLLLFSPMAFPAQSGVSNMTNRWAPLTWKNKSRERQGSLSSFSRFFCPPDSLLGRRAWVGSP